MRTVKEISDLTGISVRTLHYYDEIGLLKPTEKSDAGYRLYDDKALETLQQILFFREFDISLQNLRRCTKGRRLYFCADRRTPDDRRFCKGTCDRCTGI